MRAVTRAAVAVVERAAALGELGVDWGIHGHDRGERRLRNVEAKRTAEPEHEDTAAISGRQRIGGRDAARARELLAERENEAFGPSGAPASPTDPLQALFSDMIAAEDNEEATASECQFRCCPSFTAVEFHARFQKRG